MGHVSAVNISTLSSNILPSQKCLHSKRYLYIYGGKQAYVKYKIIQFKLKKEIPIDSQFDKVKRKNITRKKKNEF